MLAMQAGLMLACSAISWVLLDRQITLSLLAGGLTSILPNAFFGFRLFAVHGAKHARAIVKRFYHGEAMKIAMSVAMFGFMFGCVGVRPLPFFSLYIATQMMLWLAPFAFKKQQKIQVPRV